MGVCFPEPGPWPLCPLYLCGKKNLLTGRSSSATRSSLAPLGEKDHNRRWVSEGEDAPYIRYGGGALKAGRRRIWHKVSVVTTETLHNPRQSETGGSYDSVGLIIAVTVNTNIVWIGGNNRPPLPPSSLHVPAQHHRRRGEMGGHSLFMFIGESERTGDGWAADLIRLKIISRFIHCEAASFLTHLSSERHSIKMQFSSPPSTDI